MEGRKKKRVWLCAVYAIIAVTVVIGMRSANPFQPDETGSLKGALRKERLERLRRFDDMDPDTVNAVRGGWVACGPGPARRGGARLPAGRG